jgi:alpha-galactosidase
MTNAGQANVMQPVEAAAQAEGGGHFNDADMLEVGNPGLTVDEQRTHFAIWALLMPPLLISAPLNGMAQASMDILQNKEILAAHSDPLAIQGLLVSAAKVDPSTNQVWAKNFSNGDIYVVAVNADDSQPATITIDLSMVWVPPGTTVAVRNLWTHTDNGTAVSTFSAHDVPPHGCVALRLSPQ